MGYIHIYTGNGKGKTTAAFGVAIRAAMAGKKVYIGQFVKGMKYSETKIENYLENIKIEQYGETCFLENDPEPIDVERAKKGVEKILSIYKEDYDLVILDEVFIAHYLKLMTLDELNLLMDKKPEETELIMTGRYCDESLYEKADLITEMKEIKHYYKQGVLSREGIDC